MARSYDVSTCGEYMAAVYDRWPGVPQDTDAIVSGLVRIAGLGPVLEPGIAPDV